MESHIVKEIRICLLSLFLAITLFPQFVLAEPPTKSELPDFAQQFYDNCVNVQPKDGEDGWPYLERAFNLSQQAFDDTLTEFNLTKEERDLRWTDTIFDFDREFAAFDEAFLQRCRANGALDNLHQATTCSFVMYPKINGESLWLAERQPLDLSASRVLFHLQRLEGIEALGVADPARIERWAVSSVQLSRFFALQGSTVWYSIGARQIKKAFRQVRLVALSGTLSSDQLASVHIRIHGLFPTSFFQYVLDQEHVILNDLLYFLHTDDGKGDGILNIKRLHAISDQADVNRYPPAELSSEEEAAASQFASRSELIAIGDRLFRDVSDYLSLPRHERIAQTFKIEDFLPGEFELGESLRFSTLGILLPHFERLIDRFDMLKTDRAGTITVLAIARYAADHDGLYPDTLEDLVPAYLNDVPIDPFSGEPMCYQRITQPNDTITFVVYSTGADGIDDGGNLHPNGNSKATYDRTDPGFDYIVCDSMNP